MYMSFDINHPVKLRLTEKGEKILAIRHNKMRQAKIDNGGEDIGEFNIEDYLDEYNIYFETTLFNLIEIFGPDVNCDDGPIKNNKIIFQSDDYVK